MLCSDLERQADGLVIRALEKGVRKTHVLQGTEYTENKYLDIYVLHSSFKNPLLMALPVSGLLAGSSHLLFF